MDVVDPSTGERSESPDENPLTDENILAMFRQRFALSKRASQEWRTEAKGLYDMHAGHQWDVEDVAAMEENKRPAVTFNIAGKFLDAVSGLQINNRQEIRYYPRENGDTAVNEMLTGAVGWARDLCDAVDEESDAFLDCIITGMGWMECYLTADGDPAGWPACDRRDPMEMYWDPSARKKNLSDGRYIIRVKMMDQLEYQDTFGDDDQDNTFVPEMNNIMTGEGDAVEIIHEPQDYGVNPNGGAGATNRNRRPVADYQFWLMEETFSVTAEGLPAKNFSKADWKKMEPVIKAEGISYQANATKKKVYYRAFIAPGGLKRKGKSPYQHGFTHHAITGKRDRNRNSWFGVGRAIKDPQMWTNKFFSSILYTLMTNSKGGLMAEEDAFTDQSKAESEWARPDKFTMLTAGALQKGKIQQKEPARYPEGMDRLMQFSMSALPSTSGINLELLGAVDREQSGVLENQRKESAMSIIAWAFDAMRRYYRSMGRQMAHYIAEYVEPGTLVRITSKEGQQYVPLAKDKMALTFDVIVDEAPTSTNMKERVWTTLERLVPQLLQAGVPIPNEILDYAPLPTDLAVAWKQKIKGDPEAEAAEKKKADDQFAALLAKIIAEGKDKEASVEQRAADALLKRAKAQESETGLPGIQAASATSTAQAGAAIANGGMRNGTN